jgi:outer membrane protein TolC
VGHAELVTGYFTLRSADASTLLHAPSQMWSFGTAAMLTLFDGGRHSAQSFQARAAFDEQVANYRSNVLTAYQEVEYNLAALRQLQQERVSLWRSSFGVCMRACCW